jgi:hypothetical protein
MAQLFSTTFEAEFAKLKLAGLTQDPTVGAGAEHGCALL